MSGSAHTIPFAAQPTRAREAGFTLIELLIVIAIVGVLAGLIFAGGKAVGRKRTLARVQAEHAQLVTAIDAYKSKIGFYPPDNPDKAVVDADARSPLVYELKGMTTVGDPVNAFSLQGRQPVTSAELMAGMGVGGIVNADSGGGNDFLSVMKEDHVRPIPGTSLLRFVAPVDGPDGARIPFRYDSSSPNRHNQESYDLWIEYSLGGKTNLVSNWK